MRRILCAGIGLLAAACLPLLASPADAATERVAIAGPSSLIDAGPPLVIAAAIEVAVGDVACTAAPATTLVPARVELPAGMRLSTPVRVQSGELLAAGTVLTAKVVTAEAMRVPIDTRACGITHIPHAPLGQIDWFRV